MANAAKRKGSAWEREIVAFLREHGFPYAERAYGAGRPDDRGDVDGVPGVVIEAKNCARIDLAGWMAEAEVERDNARAKYGVVIAKRRGKGAADGYVVMTLATFAEIIYDGPDHPDYDDCSCRDTTEHARAIGRA